MLKQKTLGGSFSLKGKGLHTGVNLTVTFNPAPDNHGYKIQRIDLEGQPIIDAVAENVGETTRGTVLVKNDIKISTIEHGMAALYSAGIDNCLIQVDGPEFPILDGSAKYYVEEIKKVGTVEQNSPKDFYIIKSKIEFRDEETGSSIIVLPDENFSVNALISYDSKILFNQFATLEDMEKFPEEIASARTFVFVREIEPLLNYGLIKGGDLDNAIVIYEREMSQERYDKLADVMGVPHMDATQLGYINHIPLVWDNEPARHKLLDIIGDLALIGKPIKGRIIATRPGHTINNKFARQIRKEIKLHEVQAPVYNCNEAPLLGVNRIRELLPHRYPSGTYHQHQVCPPDPQRNQVARNPGSGIQLQRSSCYGCKPYPPVASAPLSVRFGRQGDCHWRQPHRRCQECNRQRTVLPRTLPRRTGYARCSSD